MQELEARDDFGCELLSLRVVTHCIVIMHLQRRVDLHPLSLQQANLIPQQRELQDRLTALLYEAHAG